MLECAIHTIHPSTYKGEGILATVVKDILEAIDRFVYFENRKNNS